MRLKFLWPGRTKSPEIRVLQEAYLAKIKAYAGCEIVETRGARGMSEKLEEKIKETEAKGIEKHLGDGFVICLTDRGKEMTSQEFAGFLGRREQESSRPPTFVVGGFLGLAERLLGRADFQLSLSRMTFSHELCRIVLMEQIYRALTIMRGHQYAK
jgi:23S rRNA (pseudouridine1915-N3)-methyltransferase